MAQSTESNIHIKDAVNRYLYKSSDNFAFQIDGPWGTGKTYFIKNTIFPLIKHNNNKFINNAQTTKAPNQFYAVVYESLSNVKNLNELELNIINSLALYSVGENGNSKAGHILLNVLGEGLSTFLKTDKHTKPYISIVKSLGKDFKVDTFINKLNELLMNGSKNILFVFDDLERTNLDIQSLFGFLSKIIENSKCKIIIVSNISKYKETDKNDYKLYKYYKEKVIDRTITFGNDSSYLAGKLLDNKLNNSINNASVLGNNWLHKASNILMKNLDDVNLRTINCIINTYNNFFGEINNECDDLHLKQKLLKVGYLSIFIFTDLYKRNIHVNFDKFILFNERFSNIASQLKNELKHNRDNKSLKQQDVKGYEYLYYKFFNGLSNIDTDKYYIFSDNILFTRDIYTLVVSDKFNVQKFINTVKNNLQKDEIRSNHLYQYILNNYNTLLYEKLIPYEQLFVHSIGDIKNINIMNLINIYSLLYLLSSYNIWFDKSYLGNIKEMILHKFKDIKPDSLDKVSLISLDSLQDNKLKKKLKNIYKNKRKLLPLYNDKMHLNKILNTGLVTIETGKWFDHKSIFNTILKYKALQNKLIKVNKNTPRHIICLIQYLNDDIINGYSNNHHIELKYSSSFIQFLKVSIQTSNEPVIKMDLIDLLECTKGCIKYIKNPNSINNEIKFNKF